MIETDLTRFVTAQDRIYSRVIEELANGSKRTHWMWFIFPQLTGLGHSALAQRYAIRDLEAARRPTSEVLEMLHRSACRLCR
jgi:uncharacterized protein (DUF1810 family)